MPGALSARTQQPSARTQREAVELTFRHAVGSFVLVGAVGVGLAGLVRGDREYGWLTLALVVVWTVVAVRGLRGLGGTTTACVLGVTAVVPLVVIGAPAPSGIHASIAAIPTMIAVVAALLVRRTLAAVALADCVLGVQLVADGLREGWPEAARWALPVLTIAVMAFGTRAVLLRAADRADRAVTEQRRSEVALTRARAGAGARLSWQGLLHDEVAAALRAASTPGIGRLEVRRTAAESVAAIEGLEASSPDGSVDVMAAVRDIASRGGTPVEVEGPWQVLVPAAAAAAVLGALAEVLRNVDRHADASTVRVDVAGLDHESLTVRVIDDGVGFRVPGRLPAGGLRVSVVDRMAQVGGSVEVTSVPGDGTVVTLAWSPVRSSAGERRVLWLPVPEARWTAAVAVLPALVAAGVLAVLRTVDGQGGTLGLLWYVAVALLTVHAVVDRQPDLRWTIGVSVLAVGGALALMAATPATDWARDGLWPVVAIGPLLLLVTLGPPVGLGAAAFAVMLLGLVAIGLRDRVGPDVLLAGVVLGSYLVVIGTFVSRTTSRLAAVVAHAAADERDQVLTAWDRTVRREVQGPLIARLEPLVLPFLRQLADGSVSAEDESVRRWAWLLEQAVRDELHLPEVLDAPTRAAVREARTAGCRVRFQADAVPQPPHQAICDIVRAALSGAAPPRELTVSVYLLAGPPTVAVVAVPGDPARAALLQAVAGDMVFVLEDQPESTWAEVRLPATTAPYGHLQPTELAD